MALPSDFFIGVAYLPTPEQADEQLRAEIGHLRKTGFKTILLYPAADWSPQTADWSFERQARIAAILAEQEISFFVTLSGHAPQLEYLPDALRTPEMAIQEDRPNQDHPAVRRLLENYLTAAAKFYKTQPHCLGYQLSETGGPTTFDIFTQALFQEWLRKKYETIGTLNTAWGRTYSSFEQIDSGIRNWTSLLPRLEWQRFRQQNEAARITWMRERVQAEHPGSLCFAAAPGTMMLSGSPETSGDDWLTAAAGDFAAFNFFPKGTQDTSPLLQDRPWLRQLVLSAYRGACRAKGFILSELQVGPASALHPESAPKAGEVLEWIEECRLAGAAGVFLWRWNAFETGMRVGGRGLLSPGSTTGPLLPELKMRLERPARAATKPAAAEFALLYDPDNENLLRQIRGENAEPLYRNALLVYGRLFHSLKTRLDILRPGDLAEKCPAERKTILLPEPIFWPADLAEKLLPFVEQGGHLFLDGPTLALDENAVTHEGQPFGPFTSKLGVEMIGIEPGTHGVQAPGFQLHFQATRGRTRLRFLREDQTLFAHFADYLPAVLQVACGEGKITASATPLALAHLDKAQAQLRSFFQLLFERGEPEGVFPVQE